MTLDWAEENSIAPEMIEYQSIPEAFSPRITIGMPTFNRPDTIRRALASIAKQSYRDYILIISDNAGRDPETLKAVEEFAPDLPAVMLIAQTENNGALANLHYLLSIAKTEYFMWLADDDEITETYVQDMVQLLDQDAQAVAAMGYWKHMKNPNEGRIREQSKHHQRHLFRRAMHYVAGPTDDSMFYALYRSENLRQCQFDDYCFPNRGVLTNFCYVFLFDMILQGPIRHTESAGWICHNYSEKQYNAAQALGVGDRVKTLLRRINVYALYCVKAAKKNPLLLPPVFLASLWGLLRDVISAAWRISGRNLKKAVG